MSAFWSVSLFWILSVLFVAIAMVIVLVPLLRKKAAPDKLGRREINIAVYRDQLKEMEADRANGLLADDQFQTAKLELEARLADDALALGTADRETHRSGRLLGYVLGVFLPIAAFGIYFWLGQPDALMAKPDAQANTANGGQPGMPKGHDMSKLAQQMEDKVQANPDDGNAWVMLGRIYSMLERWDDTSRAYQHALKLMPKVAGIRSAYAEALAINHNRDLSGEPMKLVHEALAIDPTDNKALELAGIEAFQGKRYKEAVDYLTKLYQQLPPDEPYAKDIRGVIEEAEQKGGGKMAGLDNLSEQMSAPQPNAAAGGASIKGKLDIASALKGKLAPEDTVFVFARSAQGGPPLAALRLTGSQLPAAFELTDAMAMMPTNKLSNFQNVTLTARVSKSGQPTGGSGDLEGSLNGVKVGTNDIHLTIDKIRP
jgi:cytochrome c-type biogenesis protein CcmH